MAGLEEVFYNIHSSKFSLTVKEGGVALDLTTSGITRVVIKLTDVHATSKVIIVDSAVNSAYFDYVTRGADGIIDFLFGSAGIAEGEYEAYLVLYDPQHTNGQPWPPFTLHAIDVVV